MKKLVLIFYIITALTGFIKADENSGVPLHSITGVILDENKKPLPGASVWIKGTTIGAGTNAKGEFTIHLKKGKYTLRSSFTGYMPQDLNILIPERKDLTIQLVPAENGLEEVVVTGTRTEKPLKDVPVLTRVITSEDIRKLNPVDLQTVLEYEMPGIQFGRHHGSGLPTLTFQGSEGNYVLFLIDGERVGGEGAADNVDFNRFNIDEIERIEIVKGAMSTLYGSNALGGVINIITKQANRPVVGTISARYSDRGEEKYTVSGGTKQDRFSLLTSLTYRKKDAFSIEDKEKKTTYVSGYESWQASQKLGYAFTEKFSATLTGTYYNNRRINANKEQKTQEFSNDYTINSKLTYLFNTNNQLQFSYNYDDYAKRTDYILTGRKENTYDNGIHTARLNYTGSIADKHTLTAGIEANSEKLKHYMFQDTTTHSVENYVLYAQEDWRITDHLTLVAGLRADYHSEYDLHVTPKLSMMYKMGILTLRGGYAAGFRSPSLKELYSEWNHRNMFYVVGNPDLKPEKSNHFSLSAEVTKGIFNASVSGYYNKFKDKITDTWRTGKDRRSEQFKVNANTARTTGVDATAQLRFNCGVSMQGSYSYVDDHQDLEGYNISSVRPHSATFYVNYARKFGKVKSSIGLNGRWMSEVKAWSKTTEGIFNYEKYHSRTVCSANASAQLPRGIGLNIGLNNLLNFKDKNISGDSSISPEQGISFVAAVTINIADMFKL